MYKPSSLLSPFGETRPEELKNWGFKPLPADLKESFGNAED
jgi:hypothetical protein